jgi:hypothetical protein
VAVATGLATWEASRAAAAAAASEVGGVAVMVAAGRVAREAAAATAAGQGGARARWRELPALQRRRRQEQGAPAPRVRGPWPRVDRGGGGGTSWHCCKTQRLAAGAGPGLGGAQSTAAWNACWPPKGASWPPRTAAGVHAPAARPRAGAALSLVRLEGTRQKQGARAYRSNRFSYGLMARTERAPRMKRLEVFRPTALEAGTCAPPQLYAHH